MWGRLQQQMVYSYTLQTVNLRLGSKVTRCFDFHLKKKFGADHIYALANITFIRQNCQGLLRTLQRRLTAVNLHTGFENQNNPGMISSLTMR